MLFQTCDFITPTFQGIQHWTTAKQPVEITDAGGRTANEVIALLKQHGVQVGTALFVGDTLVVNVYTQRHAWAVLARYGIEDEQYSEEDMQS